MEAKRRCLGDGNERAGDPANDETVQLIAKNNTDRDKVEDLVYNVMSAMLDECDARNPEAGAALREKVAQQLRAAVLRLEEIEKTFAPIFFDFGKKRANEQKRELWEWKPERIEVIKKWREYAAMRTHWLPTEQVPPRQSLNNEQFKVIFHKELQRYQEENPGDEKTDWNQTNEEYRHRFQAMLRNTIEGQVSTIYLYQVAAQAVPIGSS